MFSVSFSVFAQEAREQLTAMEDGLLQMEQGYQDADTLNAIFRAAHTVKGASGVVEIHHIEKFTHILENLLDKIRNGEMQLTSEIISALLLGCDHIGTLLDRVDQGRRDEDEALKQSGEATAEVLRAFTGGAATAGDKAGMVEASVGTVERAGGDTAIGDCWHISIRFGCDVMRMGMEPLAFLRYLLNLGEIAHLTTLCDGMPQADEMDPECCYLGFEITMRSHASKEQIENVFAFCRDECDLHILHPNSKAGDFIDLIERLPEESMRLGEILIKAGALTEAELSEGLRRQQAAVRIAVATEKETPQLGEILVEKKMVQPEIVEAAAAKQKQVGAYYKHVVSGTDAHERQTMVDLLTTNETYFFREAAHFDFLRKAVLPQHPRSVPFEIWSGASSTGEEIYTLAMVLADELGPDGLWSILGSDISTRVLAIATRGQYWLDRVRGLPQSCLHQYCLKGVRTQEGSFLIDPLLRRHTRFMQINLNVALPEIGKFHVIFLRNVMIYFDVETKRRVVARMVEKLRPGGYLIVGHSESLNGINATLKPVVPTIYRLPG